MRKLYLIAGLSLLASPALADKVFFNTMSDYPAFKQLTQLFSPQQQNPVISLYQACSGASNPFGQSTFNAWNIVSVGQDHVIVQVTNVVVGTAAQAIPPTYLGDFPGAISIDCSSQVPMTVQ